MPEGEPNSPVDWSAVLQTTYGDRQLLQELAGIFLEESDRLLAQLKQAQEEGDAVGARRAAHTLKGQCAIFGATSVQALAFELELAAQNCQVDAGAKLSEFEPALVGLQTQVRAFVVENADA